MCNYHSLNWIFQVILRLHVIILKVWERTNHKGLYIATQNTDLLPHECKWSILITQICLSLSSDQFIIIGNGQEGSHPWLLISTWIELGRKSEQVKYAAQHCASQINTCPSRCTELHDSKKFPYMSISNKWLLPICKHLGTVQIPTTRRVGGFF